MAVNCWRAAHWPDAIKREKPSLALVSYVLKLAPGGSLLYGSYVGGSASGAPAVVLDGGRYPFFPIIQTGSRSTIMDLSTDGLRIIQSQPYASNPSVLVFDGQGGVYRGGVPYPDTYAWQIVACPITSNYIQTPTTTLIWVARFDIY